MSTRTALVAIALLLLGIAIVSPHGSSSKGPYHADIVRSPGVLNPDVTQANIDSTICLHGWTRTIRPPTSYTNDLKRKQMREYGVGGSLSDYQEDHLISLERPVSEFGDEFARLELRTKSAIFGRTALGPAW